MKLAPEIDALIKVLAKLPGMGPRSARRAVLAMFKRRDDLMSPLHQALGDAMTSLQDCAQCGNIDTQSPCRLCTDTTRQAGHICVVEQVDDLWAIERARLYRGRFFVLGGVLAALQGDTPETLGIDQFVSNVITSNKDTEMTPITEIVLAVSATVEGQATAHYIEEAVTHACQENSLAPPQISHLAHGLPVGGTLDFMDEGTLTMAFRQRRNYRGVAQS